jgi:hypothetical protein
VNCSRQLLASIPSSQASMARMLAAHFCCAVTRFGAA